MSGHVILSKEEADAVNKDIKDNSGDVVDKFPYGGWSINATAARLKDGTYAMSREVIEELQRRGGGNATKIGGVDLKNRLDHIIKDSDRVKT